MAAHEGSTIGISKVTGYSQVKDAYDLAARYDDEVLAEEFIEGRELTVAILGSALYGSADALAQAVPALAGPLKAYVGFVDSLRLHLDGLMQSATVAINGD